MQIFIVIMMICAAAAYLILKYLPANSRKLLMKKIPELTKLLKVPTGDCSGGCSSCGACAETSTKKNTDRQVKVIKVFSNSSRMN